MEIHFDISKVKGIHKGKRAIVLGAGYSLDDNDFSNLPEDDIVFACNRSVITLKKCNYFCMTDGSIPRNNYFNYGANIANNIAFCSGEWFFKHDMVRVLYESIKDKALFFDRRYKSPSSFNFDEDDLLITGFDVTHVITHLAYKMGCDPIILSGVDLNYRNGQKYCKDRYFNEDIECSRELPPVKVLDDKSSDHGLIDSLKTWKKIRDCNKHVNILNSSLDSALKDVFETIPLY